jgi:hypothetical protein
MPLTINVSIEWCAIFALLGTCLFMIILSIDFWARHNQP